MSATKKIGTQIFELRKEKGLTQEELAKKAGITQSHLTRIENNQYPPRFSTLEKIADVFDMQLVLIPK